MVTAIKDVQYPRLPCQLSTHKKVQRYAKKNKFSLTKATDHLVKLGLQSER